MSSPSPPGGSKSFFLLTTATTTATTSTKKKKTKTSPRGVAELEPQAAAATRNNNNNNDKRSAADNQCNTTKHAAKRPKTAAVNETSKSIVGNAAVKIGAKNLFPPSNHQQQRDTVAPHQPSKVNQSAVEEEEDDDDGDRPHFRNNCPNQPFVAMPFLVIREHQDNQDVCHIPHCMSRGAETNIATCSMCYCYVCNKPAKECRQWSSTTMITKYTTGYHNHCHAVNQGDAAKYWKNMQDVYTTNQDDDDDRTKKLDHVYIVEREADEDARELKNNSSLAESWSLPSDLCVGAISPKEKHRVLPFLGVTLFECRKCGWYTPLSRRDDARDNSAGCWCQACGRVALEECFKDNSGQPYKPKPDDVYIGSKTIPFRIKVHDPRNMTMFQPFWSKYEGTSPKWIDNEAEMEEDMFRHNFGKFPSLRTILANIPVVEENKIPRDGHHESWKSNRRPAARAEDTDAILLTDRIHIIILQELHSVGFSSSGHSVKGDITAKWNREERCGELVVRLFCRINRKRANAGALLGAWFGAVPFSLCDVAGNMIATRNLENPFDHNKQLPLPPFDFTDEKQMKRLYNKAQSKMAEAVDSFNEKAQAFQSTLSLQSSLGDGSLLGGVCSSDTSFSGVLRRYFAEMLPEHVISRHCQNATVSWVGRAVGVTSHHRKMGFESKGSRSNGSEFRDVSLESYLRKEDIFLACENLHKGCRALDQGVDSINAVLLHLENLDHEEAPFVEGLNVELLPFQRQTLQWALERERNPGGLQSYLWAKLPSVEDEKSPNVYYNLLLGQFTNRRPNLIRGGIIGDEMGLGKTVISLALILQNQPPVEPASGSDWSSLMSDSSSFDGVGWNPYLRRIPGRESRRASIVSRGTLVVCPVSVVGQWIEEAKRRLKDPGLVYAYHGPKRQQDATILAQYSIVVTTYQTLAKERTYHTKKAAKQGVRDYCPPCNQIRWWRIICDESHTLKHDTAQTWAVFDLVGDHKWAVSGTPWSTSLSDIKNQLEFIGLKDIDSLFLKFSDTIMPDVDPRHRYRRWNQCTRFGEFMFLMRAVMIRHSQNQMYRGTSTTLMSLPRKTERTLLIDFKGEEATIYENLEKEVIESYQAFREKNRKHLSRHYLKLIQMLVPLRVACAGGHIPLTADGDDEEDDVPVTEKKKKKQVFSEFSFKRKLNFLIRELKKIRDNEPGSKSLVFSQYSSSLKFLQGELPKHGFQFRTLSGNMTLKQRAQALYAFEHDPPTTIFLLSMRAGAVGINLTQANRVFLLEPAMNPSLEEQAIGRVHRLGQTRPVQIVRLIMKDSIEMRINEFVKTKYPRSKHITTLSVGSDSSVESDTSIDSNSSVESDSECVASDTSVESDNASVESDDASAVSDSSVESDTSDESASIAESDSIAKSDTSDLSDLTAGDTRPVVAPANIPIVGSLQTDKAAIMAEEFDFLFGVTDSIDPGPVVQPLCTSDDAYNIIRAGNDLFEVYMDIDETPDCVESGRI